MSSCEKIRKLLFYLHLIVNFVGLSVTKLVWGVTLSYIHTFLKVRRCVERSPMVQGQGHTYRLSVKKIQNWACAGSHCACSTLIWPGDRELVFRDEPGHYYKQEGHNGHFYIAHLSHSVIKTKIWMVGTNKHTRSSKQGIRAVNVIISEKI